MPCGQHMAIFALIGDFSYSLQLFGFQTFVEDLFCQPLAIPKTAADITETSLEVEMDTSRLPKI